MDHTTAVRDNLVEKARTVVTSVVEQCHPLSGACIVSSLPAGDFTSASDVDMLLVADDSDGKPGIHRRLVGDKVIEWVVLPNDYLRDTDRILRDAGLCHDMLTAIILLDTNRWLGQAQEIVALHYQEPQWIWQRTRGQFERVANAIAAVQQHVADGNILMAQRAHVSVIKGLLGVPRAILNKRCTMARGLLFCREATAELGWPGFLADVIAVLGAPDSEATVADLQDTAARIIDATEFAETEKAIRRWFLQSSHWLLENSHPADAVWPLYFWSSTTVDESGGNRLPVLWKQWQKFAAILGIGDEQELLEKNEQAQRVYESALGLAEACKPRLGL